MAGDDELRMERNFCLLKWLDELSSLITEMEMFTDLEKLLSIARDEAIIRGMPPDLNKRRERDDGLILWKKT
jgi:hypothetical protein